jgi:DNA-binding PadR family transcriptional regulator
MIEELGRHDYKLSADVTLYPTLHVPKQRGYLVSGEERVGNSIRRVYRATTAGCTWISDLWRCSRMPEISAERI